MIMIMIIITTIIIIIFIMIIIIIMQTLVKLFSYIYDMQVYYNILKITLVFITYGSKHNVNDSTD